MSKKFEGIPLSKIYLHREFKVIIWLSYSDVLPVQVFDEKHPCAEGLKTHT